MAKKKGRDWSEWQKQVTGMHRLENEFRKPRDARRHHHHKDTTASMVLPPEFHHDQVDDRKMLKWILIFLCGLLLRKCYFEITKYERVRNEATTMSRKK